MAMTGEDSSGTNWREGAVDVEDEHSELRYGDAAKGEPNPWEYAIYHCNTSANVYSKVHWSYFPNGKRGKAFTITGVR